MRLLLYFREGFSNPPPSELERVAFARFGGASRDSRLLSMLLILMTGCILDPIPTDDLRCECASGWTCVEGVCVEGDFGICGRADASEGTVQIENLRVDWVTANQVQVRWDLVNTDELFTYELDIASTEMDLTTRDDVRVVTGSENPDLSRTFIVGAEAGDEVRFTVARQLDPDSSYFLRLVAFDELGGVSCTNTIAVITGPTVLGGQPLFREEHPGSGETLPPCMDLVTDPGLSFQGDAHYAYEVFCAGEPVCEPPSPDEETASCFENARLRGFRRTVEIESDALFERAFYEIAVSIENSAGGVWSELGVHTDAGFFFQRPRTLIADGDYHVYQVPLSVMTGEGSVMTLADLAGGIDEFRVGSLWLNGAIVRIDEAWIRF